MIDLLRELETSQYLFPRTIEEIKEMNGLDFENFIFWYFKKNGYEVQKTQQTNDSGIDLIIDTLDKNNNNVRIGIQCKRWSSPIPKDEITKMQDGKKTYKIDKLCIIYTSRLTSEADKLCDNYDIAKKGIEHLERMLDDLTVMENIQFRKLKTKEKKEETLNEKEKLMFSKISSIRYKIAIENKVPAYIIFKNKTINDLIKKRPKNIEELLNFPGLNKIKIDDYGEEIIKILNE